MESWGLEFLDDGAYGRLNDSTASGTIHQLVLPMALVLEIAEPRLLVEARNRTEKIEHLRASIQAVGLQTPGTCYIDHSIIRYQDGYHRLVSCVDLGYAEFPVIVHQANQPIKAKGMQLRYLTEQLMTLHYQKGV